MRVKAFIGSNGNWLNVTPTTPVTAEQLNASDERAWQRDIKKFLKKTKYPKHVLRETLVVRIPVEASDGYFQLVLCPGDKKKVLCPSPVFRVLSTSSSPHSLRGASLSTLPLELGALALTTYATNTIGRVISPAMTAAQTAVKPFMPSSKKIEAATMLYSTTGTQEIVNTTIQNGNVEYVMPTHAGAGAGVESGPAPPYPIYFAARAEIAANGDYFSMPTMNLTGVSEHIDHQLRGHYFAWAHVHGAAKNANPALENGSWSQTVVSSVQVRAADILRASITQAGKKAFKIHFISDDFEPQLYAGMKLDIKIMGFLRADGTAASSDFEQELVASLNDIMFAQNILSEPTFAPDVEVGDQSRRGMLERASTSYAATRLAAQRQLDKVPLHRMGLRMDVDRVRDQAIGVNGFYVRR
ncbi:and NB-ARC domain protein [Rutstroemia sp. NJR-2017a WRK4]|nr:and NB-ARC domain protein [Rutstroemia sp. NJR-2017a WRK4]